jgi:uncharacterized protein YbbC (DUF1343 family)
VTGVQIGFERLLAERPLAWQKARLGLLCNQATVGRAWQPLWQELARQFPQNLRALFGPQHGLWGEKQDNMVASADGVEPVTGLPVFSLYGERLRPSPESLELIDVLLVDLPDVGTRVYTFAATMAYAMQAAARQGKQVVILDRPNPIGGVQVEGNVLQPEMASIVGPYPLPMRHGMTLGELARYYNEVGQIGCDLAVVPMRGWSRSQYFETSGLPWVMPSPNLPTLDTAMVYPGQVLWEGTNLSEGRGTTRPFELFGAPFINPWELKAALKATSELPGVFLRETWFQPTFHKWAGEVCGGFHLHVTDRRAFKPYLTTLIILQGIMNLYPDQFQWRQPPYEYEYERRPIDLLMGDPKIREGLESGVTVLALEQQWQSGLEEFLGRRQKYLLYFEAA